MNFVRTMLLLAALTALFMSVGYLIGGTGGALIALIFAVGTNAFAYWNSDKVALRMHNAEPVTRASAPELFDMVQRLAQNAGLPMPRVYPGPRATSRTPSPPGGTRRTRRWRRRPASCRCSTARSSKG